MVQRRALLREAILFRVVAWLRHDDATHTFATQLQQTLDAINTITGVPLAGKHGGDSDDDMETVETHGVKRARPVYDSDPDTAVERAFALTRRHNDAPLEFADLLPEMRTEVFRWLSMWAAADPLARASLTALLRVSRTVASDVQALVPSKPTMPRARFDTMLQIVTTQSRAVFLYWALQEGTNAANMTAILRAMSRQWRTEFFTQIGIYDRADILKFIFNTVADQKAPKDMALYGSMMAVAITVALAATTWKRQKWADSTIIRMIADNQQRLSPLMMNLRDEELHMGPADKAVVLVTSRNHMEVVNNGHEDDTLGFTSPALIHALGLRFFPGDGPGVQINATENPLPPRLVLEWLASRAGLLTDEVACELLMRNGDVRAQPDVFEVLFRQLKLPAQLNSPNGLHIIWSVCVRAALYDRVDVIAHILQYLPSAVLNAARPMAFAILVGVAAMRALWIPSTQGMLQWIATQNTGALNLPADHSELITLAATSRPVYVRISGQSVEIVSVDEEGELAPLQWSSPHILKELMLRPVSRFVRVPSTTAIAQCHACKHFARDAGGQWLTNGVCDSVANAAYVITNAPRDNGPGETAAQERTRFVEKLRFFTQRLVRASNGGYPVGIVVNVIWPQLREIKRAHEEEQVGADTRHLIMSFHPILFGYPVQLQGSQWTANYAAALAAIIPLTLDNGRAAMSADVFTIWATLFSAADATRDTQTAMLTLFHAVHLANSIVFLADVVAIVQQFSALTAEADALFAEQLRQWTGSWTLLWKESVVRALVQNQGVTDASRAALA